MQIARHSRFFIALFLRWDKYLRPGGSLPLGPKPENAWIPTKLPEGSSVTNHRHPSQLSEAKYEAYAQWAIDGGRLETGDVSGGLLRRYGWFAHACTTGGWDLTYRRSLTNRL